MTSRTLLATGREDLRGHIMATLAEVGDDIELLGVAENSQDLLLALEAQQDIDLVVIDDQIGSLPYLALTREVIARGPDIGVILLVGEADANAYQAAMDAGARAVLEIPPSVGELSARLPGILEWQRQIRGLTSAMAVGGGPETGRTIALVGAKGGVGTSTLALHLALLAAASNPEGRICIIDMDLQQRGLRHLIELPAKRSIADLVTIADSLSGRNLDEATIVHRSGLRFLMAPEHGEQAEDVNGQVARQVLAVAKGHYDIVIIDAGSTVTEASAVAMEFADDLLLVATPDIATLRAAQDKYDLLARLQVVKDIEPILLFNKVSPRNEVQPELGARMAIAESSKVNIPEDWRRIEPIANALAPTEMDDGPFRRAVVALGNELRLALARPRASATTAAPQASTHRPDQPGRKRRRRRGDDDGQVTIEAVVGLGAALVMLLILMQTALMALGLVVSRRAADEAARVGTRGGDSSQVLAAARGQTPGFYRVEVTQVGPGRYRATATAPSLLPWLNRPISAVGSAAPED